VDVFFMAMESIGYPIIRYVVGLISPPTNFVQFKEPPLLGPGAAFPPFATPEFHPTTPENWKGATIHPTGLMKEPAVVPGRNAPVAFTAQGQTQGAVMMVYGLDHDTSNTDKLFNLVCLYGNVARSVSTVMVAIVGQYSSIWCKVSLIDSVIDRTEEDAPVRYRNFQNKPKRHAGALHKTFSPQTPLAFFFRFFAQRFCLSLNEVYKV
ncbi:hypothetical protein GQX74_005411, partial [Glossina fuscipes]